MNFPYINWENHTLKLNHKYANLHNSFMDMLDKHHMCQTIMEPTRGENTLDLFLTNNESLVNNCQVTPGISDHSAVLVESRVRTNIGKQKPRLIPMWNKMKPEDSKAFRKYMKEGWESISDETKQGSADTLWNWLTSRLEEGIKKYVPHRAAGKKDRHPWISRKLKQMLKQEKKLHSKVKSYRSQNNKIPTGILGLHWKHHPTQATQNDKKHGDKNKSFWTYIKHNKQDSIGVASLRDPETGRLETDQTAKARILNKQFQSVFSPRMPSKLTPLCWCN